MNILKYVVGGLVTLPIIMYVFLLLPIQTYQQWIILVGGFISMVLLDGGHEYFNGGEEK